jgi:hypothetical protein
MIKSLRMKRTENMHALVRIEAYADFGGTTRKNRPPGRYRGIWKVILK